MAHPPITDAHLHLRPRSVLSIALALIAACTLASASTPAFARPVHHRVRARVTAAPEEGAPPVVPFRFFSGSSFWNEPVAPDAPLDPDSAALVNALANEVAEEEQAKNGPWINTTSYSVPIYTVPANQPTITVQLTNHSPEQALQQAWSAVPLPAGAQPAKGSDGDLVLWQPSTNRLWEFWQLSHEGGTWHASWGGAIQNTTASQGVYSTGAWPGAKPWWGVSASSLSLVGGLITLEDLAHAEINHALSIAIPDTRANLYATPAQRDDGTSTSPLALPEGAHLRLNPHLNLTSLHLPKLTLMIAQAAQRYGIFVTDTSSNISLYAQDPNTTTNPYTAPNGYFENKYPTQLLANFPWNQLQLLNMNTHTRS
jgi:hypothetical protein